MLYSFAFSFLFEIFSIKIYPKDIYKVLSRNVQVLTTPVKNKSTLSKPYEQTFVMRGGWEDGESVDLFIF